MIDFSLAKIFYKADMGLLFENPNAKSLSKKWCATNMLPIYTPLQVLPFKTEKPCAKIVPMGSQSTDTIPVEIRKEESIG